LAAFGAAIRVGAQVVAALGTSVQSPTVRIFERATTLAVIKFLDGHLKAPITNADTRMLLGLDPSGQLKGITE
jgi:hypothetical protein